VLVYHAVQPIATIKRHIVVMPPKAHLEPGFFHALLRIWNIERNSGAVIVFYAAGTTIDILKKIIKKVNIEAEFNAIQSWKEMESAAKSIEDDEALIMLMSKKSMISYMPQMRIVPDILNNEFLDKNYLLIFPFTNSEDDFTEKRSVSNHKDYVEIGNIIGKIFK